MTIRDTHRHVNSYLIQTIHRCNLLLTYKSPSRKRLDLITRRLRAAMVAHGPSGLTFNQVSILLAKAYSSATARRFELAQRKAISSWRSRTALLESEAQALATARKVALSVK